MKLSKTPFLATAALTLGLSSAAIAQTGAADTTKKPQTPVYSIRNARVIMPGEIQKRIDNANVAYATQFAGAYPVSAGLDIDQKSISNIQQLTFAGENLAPSFSPDGKRIIFEARSFNDVTCRQVFSLAIDGSDPRRISTGQGESMDGVYSAKGDKILFSSTHTQIGGACPPIADYELRWRIPVNPLHDLFVTDTLGKKIDPLTADTKFYDGMGVISPDNKHVVFSSTRAGDVDLYYLDLTKNEIQQLTTSEGFDGMARFSPDGKKIVFSASRPVDQALATYRVNLLNGSVNVDASELYIIDLESNTMSPITTNGARNVYPSFSPNGEYLIFASNMHDTSRNDMAIYTLRLSDNQVVQQINSEASEDYPVWSPDGKKIAYVSNRKRKTVNEWNIYIADWKTQ